MCQFSTQEIKKNQTILKSSLLATFQKPHPSFRFVLKALKKSDNLTLLYITGSPFFASPFVLQKISSPPFWYFLETSSTLK